MELKEEKMYGYFIQDDDKAHTTTFSATSLERHLAND
jgi:hypothetical protein